MISYKLGTYGFLNLDNLDKSPLTLLDFGIEKRQDEVYDFHNSGRNYNGYLFQYTFSGCGIYEREKEMHQLTEGKAFFISMPDTSRYYLPLNGKKSEEPWQYFYLHFDGAAAAPFFCKIQQQFGNIIEIPVESKPVRLFISLFEKLQQEQSLKKYEGGEFLYSFLCSLLRELETPASESRSVYVQQAIVLIETNFDKLSGIEELAAKLNISFAYLARIFKKEMGLSPIRYLTNIRLQKAMLMLLNSKASVEEIAILCGFSCGNYFCKVFRKIMKMSPLEYRKRDQNK